MKFTVNKNDILDVLSKIQGLTGRKSNLSITETVLIRTSDTGIVLTVTDLETGFEGIYPASIEKVVLTATAISGWIVSSVWRPGFPNSQKEQILDKKQHFPVADISVRTHPWALQAAQREKKNSLSYSLTTIGSMKIPRR